MIYVKTIGDREVFSNCHTIKTNDGAWVSNPTAEQIAAAGWVEYIPPVLPPIPQTEPTYNDMLTAVKNMLSPTIKDLTDEEALEIAALYPTWISKIDSEVSVGERVWYNEKLYKVIQAHTVQNDWTPDVATSLFAEVSIEEYPEWVRPTSAETAYNEGDKVAFEGEHYMSLINANTWSPTEYPAGWQKC